MKRLLLDQGLPASTAALLRQSGWDVVHVSEIGMSRASDAEIVRRARAEDALDNGALLHPAPLAPSKGGDPLGQPLVY